MSGDRTPPSPGSAGLGGLPWVLDAEADVGDVRDYLYQPALIPLKSAIAPETALPWWSKMTIRNQGAEPSCTGHALAALIDHLRAQAAEANGQRVEPRWASATMLYQTARYHDRWPGERYRGSSIRGVLKAFYFNGVASERDVHTMQAKAARKGGSTADWHMNRAILESARSVQLGAYFRVRPRLADLHAALNEVGLVLASADIHDGWRAEGGEIPFDVGGQAKRGRHAFLICGYDQDGLVVQNSWGPHWGKEGLARWRYEDWAANIVDMWVIRLGAPLLGQDRAQRLPQIAANRAIAAHRGRFEMAGTDTLPPPSRLDVIGHLIPLAHGKLERHGHYHVDDETMLETARIVRFATKPDNSGYRYRHLLIHFMGLQADEEAAVAAIRDTLPVYKANGIYPAFVMLENGLSAALHRLVAETITAANAIMGPHATPEKDRQIEGELSVVGQRLMDEIARSARATLRVVTAPDGACLEETGQSALFLREVFQRQARRHGQGSLNYHIAAHGFGALLAEALFRDAAFYDTRPVISSLHLFAPMLTRAGFEAAILPLIAHPREARVNRRTARESIVIEAARLTVLDAVAQRGDPYLPGYGKSWPELWARVGALGAALRGEGGEAAVERLPMLALPEVAEATMGAAGGARNLSLHALAPGSLARAEPRHRDLDLRMCLLDTVIETMLGSPPAMSFARHYAHRHSFLMA